MILSFFQDRSHTPHSFLFCSGLTPERIFALYFSGEFSGYKSFGRTALSPFQTAGNKIRNDGFPSRTASGPAAPVRNACPRRTKKSGGKTGSRKNRAGEAFPVSPPRITAAEPRRKPPSMRIATVLPPPLGRLSSLLPLHRPPFRIRNIPPPAILCMRALFAARSAVPSLHGTFPSFRPSSGGFPKPVNEGLSPCPRAPAAECKKTGGAPRRRLSVVY